MEKARARSRATCGARPRNWMPSSAAASLSPARRRIDRAAILLDQVEQRVAALLLEHVADQRAEHVHVVAQRGVFGRELDVVALHGARHSTVNIRGLASGHRVWNHALMHEPRTVTPAPRHVVRRRRGHSVCQQGAVRQGAVPARRGIRAAGDGARAARHAAVRAGSRCAPTRDGAQPAARRRRCARACSRPRSPASSATTSARWWISGR